MVNDFFAVYFHFGRKAWVCYSLFSALGEKVAASVPKSMSINRLISVQSILTNCIISFYMALVLYKLINIRPELIKMEEHVVFDP